SFSQSTWFWQEPLPTGNFMWAVDFVNQNTGYAVGDVGTIMKTTNGGDNWTSLNINSGEYNLASVSAADENSILVSNESIFRSTDAGISWSNVLPGSGNLRYYVDFPSLNVGYAAGGLGIIRKTTNGGLNWFQQNSGVSTFFYKISFSDTLNGIASTTTGIVRTTNGGVNWLYTNFNISPIDYVASCSEPDNSNLFAVTARNDFFKSTDGGLNWSSVKLPMDPSDISRSCSFSDMNTGYVTTSYGYILSTTNAGNTWQTDSSLKPPYYQIGVLYGVCTVDNDIAYVSGSGGRVIKTTNSGNNWNTTTGGRSNLEANFFVNENTGYTVGYDGIILKTTNGGNNWIQKNSGTSRNLNDVFF
ncbi:MAG TPA: YCF48-related protein, partial [Ignavibacteria bacterium]|nr:YCF48-related protein [Ignavibacteria bacterium]